MKYDITIRNTNGQKITERTGCTLAHARVEAKKLADSIRASGSQVYVEWYRKSDGQQGYLNRGGDHAITGQAW